MSTTRRRSRPKDNDERSANAIAPNAIAGQFETDAPNRRWVADFIFFGDGEGLALCGHCDRPLLAPCGGLVHEFINDGPTRRRCAGTAIWRRGKPDALMHHSDRGSQHTSEPFPQLMVDHGVACSMNRSGNCWDNAAMESFFSSLKIERALERSDAVPWLIPFRSKAGISESTKISYRYTVPSVNE